MYRPEGYNASEIVLRVRKDSNGTTSPDMYVGAGADAISPHITKTVYDLIMDDKYTHIEFHKEHYAEFLSKLRNYLGFIPEE